MNKISNAALAEQQAATGHEVDESLYETHTCYLMSIELFEKGPRAGEAFREVCGHLAHVYDLSGKISDIDQPTIERLKLFLEQYMGLCDVEIEAEMESLRDFLTWTKSMDIPTQDLMMLKNEARN